MIPPIIARELRDTIMDYLETSFALSDGETAAALREFLLNTQQGIFKGPYVDLRLPFRAQGDEGEVPLDIQPPFSPYAHQLQAFERLTSRNGHGPQHTLVTTGTGSGKTECFLYPILDHCWRESLAGRKGIKAIILYPMNALAADQARRLASMIWEREELRSKVTAGMYVGRDENTQEQQVMTKDGLVTDRNTLRRYPPDILLTNYRMLDFLLLRKEDQGLWPHNEPDTLRYLVLDELHTYDGAQGGDVACLIRRLRAKVSSAPGLPCSVGTSATLGSRDGEAAGALCEFASNLFGQTFGHESLVLEQRISPSEFFSRGASRYDLPEDVTHLVPKEDEDPDAYQARLTELWFGEATTDPVELGKTLIEHDLTRIVVSCMDRPPVEWNALRQAVGRWEPEFAARDGDAQDLLLASFISLISMAKRQEGSRLRPLVTVQSQIWVREMSRMVREVRAKPGFFWRDDRKQNDRLRGLPGVYCEECGNTGWVGVMRKGDDQVNDAWAGFVKAYFSRSRDVVYLFPDHRRVLEDGRRENGDASGSRWLCPLCLRVHYRGAGDQGPPSCSCVDDDKPEHQPFPIRIQQSLSGGTPPQDLRRCPACDTRFSLGIIGRGAASLSSVAISHLFLSRRNREKKLLAFTDSVQDAAHRAAFFRTRTFRIGFRSAIQGAVVENDGVRLSDMGERLWESLAGRVWPELSESARYAKLVASLMPPDLADLPEYVDFIEQPNAANRKKVLWRLHDRLQWEVTMEYGHNARVGRTLEKVGSSCAVVDGELLAPVVDRLALVVPEEFPGSELQDLEPGQIRHFLLGLLERTRIRGGVEHKFIHAYAREQGKWFFLTKPKRAGRAGNRLISPFSSRSRLPRLLTDRGGHEVFDSYVAAAKRTTWFVDWAQRVLGRSMGNSDINELYRLAIGALVDGSILVDLGPSKKSKKKQGSALALRPDALRVSADVVRVRCRDCGHVQTIPRQHEGQWLDRPCMSFRCAGRYGADQRDTGLFYRRIYNAGQVDRVFTAEHTGLLKRPDRERVEKLFVATGSSEVRADAPNLLTCTPTLEMGIDVGDLSATMACSIPPTTANYLQRIGRAGRETGNAAILALANARPHDLYFFAEPLEMLAGDVTPPGCFLDAPEVLKRQLLAFCWDCWAAEDPAATVTPKKLDFMLSQHDKGEYTARFAAFCLEHRAALTDRFLALFPGDLRHASVERLRSLGRSGELLAELNEVVGQVGQQIRDYRQRRDRLKERQRKVEANPSSVENPDDVLAEYDEEQQLLIRLIRNIQGKYPLQLLSDKGLLPNYAFPEKGVTLRATVRGVQSQASAEPEERQRRGSGLSRGDYETHEWVRPAASAIAELAPFNTFYAENRKVAVDQVDVGGRKSSKVEPWVLCTTCQYMVLKHLVPEGTKTCLRCGSSGFDDVGQEHDLLRLERVGANTDLLSARFGDESEDREQRNYLCYDFFQIDESNWGQAFFDGEVGFGFEFLRNVTLRELNFGLRSSSPGTTCEIAGHTIPEQGFLLCADCGVVCHPKEPDKTLHRFHCHYRGTGRQVQWRNVYLYRQMESEAIRVLVPTSRHQVGEVVTTFQACLSLGLRLRFRGRPLHLAMRQQDEPTADGGSRRFLVLYDTVPGGTGYLEELAKKDGFTEVLDLAYRAVCSCGCGRENPEDEEGRDGCYRCLFAYQDQYRRERVSRRLGEQLLAKVLRRRGALERRATLSDVPVDQLEESELERRFEDCLGLAARQRLAGAEQWIKTVRHGKGCFELTVAGRNYLVEPQVSLGYREDLSPSSRPDFVIWPEGGTGAGAATSTCSGESLPIAVFTDGYAYHVQPGDEKGRLWDDLLKRRALWQHGGFRCWSLAWHDTEGWAGDHRSRVMDILNGAQADLQRKVLAKFNEGAQGKVHVLNGISQLLMYLSDPSQGVWSRRAAALAMGVMGVRPRPADSSLAEDRLLWLLRSTEHLDELGDETLPSVAPPPGLGDEDQRLALFATAESKYLRLGVLMPHPPTTKPGLLAATAQVVLRLEDHPAARQGDGADAYLYKQEWRQFLLLTNVLQFLPRFQATTTTLAAALPHDTVLEAGVVRISVPPTPMPTNMVPEEWQKRQGALDELMADCSDLVKPLLEQLRLRSEPVPELDFPLVDSSGNETGLAELAWEQHLVVVLVPAQHHCQPAFEKAGWTAIMLDEGSDLTSVWHALAGPTAQSTRPPTTSEDRQGEGRG